MKTGLSTNFRGPFSGKVTFERFIKLSRKTPEARAVATEKLLKEDRMEK